MKLIRKNNKKGFTLVELIVVIAIIAILALILIPAISGYITRAEEQRVDSSARALYSQAIILHSEGKEIGDETKGITKTLADELKKSGKKEDTVEVKKVGDDLVVKVSNGTFTAEYPKAAPTE